MSVPSQPNSGLPPWLRDDNLEEAPLNSPVPPNSNHSVPVQVGHTQKTPEQEKRASMIHWSLRIITMVLCVLMCATSVVGVGK